MRKNYFKDERGQTAILSVIFFTILMMVLTVSFMRIVTAEQAQTTNSELEASAMAAAESGVEDAKRVLKYCSDIPTGHARYGECQAAINNTGNNCSAVNKILGVVGVVDADIGDDGQVRVGKSGSQHYSCLIINERTSDVEYPGLDFNSGQSQVIPLNFVSGGDKVDKIKIEWHKSGDSATGGDGEYTLISGNAFPSVKEWSMNGGDSSPAVMRVELVRVPANNPFSVNDLTANARAVTVRPTSSSSSPTIATTGGSNSAHLIDYWQPNVAPNESQAPLLSLKCNASVGSGGYACAFTFRTNQGDFDWSQNNYYLRIQQIYRSAQFRVTGLTSGDKAVAFDGVQPKVDVTGRAMDAYKRIDARLEPAAPGNAIWWPEYAIDSGGRVCKNMSVSAQDGRDQCSYD